MEQSTRVKAGAALMAVGSLGIFSPVVVSGVPLPVLSVAVMLLAVGTLLVGTSAMEPDEQPV